MISSAGVIAIKSTSILNEKVQVLRLEHLRGDYAGRL
jgi:hypothetical protein